MLKVFYVSLILVFVLLVCANSSFSQATVSIQGTVKDRRGAVIAGATLLAVNTQTNFQRSTTTTSEGFYIFSQMPVGTYRIKVVSSGFSQVIREIIANVGQAITVDFELDTGSVENSSGQLTGIITDRRNKIIPDAQIKIISKETGEIKEITADSKGQYKIIDLSIGRYRIEVEAVGYKPKKKDLRIKNEKPKTQNFRLDKTDQ